MHAFPVSRQMTSGASNVWRTCAGGPWFYRHWCLRLWNVV